MALEKSTNDESVLDQTEPVMGRRKSSRKTKPLKEEMVLDGIYPNTLKDLEKTVESYRMKFNVYVVRGDRTVDNDEALAMGIQLRSFARLLRNEKKSTSRLYAEEPFKSINKGLSRIREALRVVDDYTNADDIERIAISSSDDAASDNDSEYSELRFDLLKKFIRSGDRQRPQTDHRNRTKKKPLPCTPVDGESVDHGLSKVSEVLDRKAQQTGQDLLAGKSDDSPVVLRPTKRFKKSAIAIEENSNLSQSKPKKSPGPKRKAKALRMEQVKLPDEKSTTLSSSKLMSTKETAIKPKTSPTHPKLLDLEPSSNAQRVIQLPSLYSASPQQPTLPDNPNGQAQFVKNQSEDMFNSSDIIPPTGDNSQAYEWQPPHLRAAAILAPHDGLNTNDVDKISQNGLLCLKPLHDPLSKGRDFSGRVPSSEKNPKNTVLDSTDSSTSCLQQPAATGNGSEIKPSVTWNQGIESINHSQDGFHGEDSVLHTLNEAFTLGTSISNSVTSSSNNILGPTQQYSPLFNPLSLFQPYETTYKGNNANVTPTFGTELAAHSQSYPSVGIPQSLEDIIVESRRECQVAKQKILTSLAPTVLKPLPSQGKRRRRPPRHRTQSIKTKKESKSQQLLPQNEVLQGQSDPFKIPSGTSKRTHHQVSGQSATAAGNSDFQSTTMGFNVDSYHPPPPIHTPSIIEETLMQNLQSVTMNHTAMPAGLHYQPMSFSGLQQQLQCPQWNNESNYGTSTTYQGFQQPTISRMSAFQEYRRVNTPATPMNDNKLNADYSKMGPPISQNEPSAYQNMCWPSQGARSQEIDEPHQRKSISCSQFTNPVNQQYVSGSSVNLHNDAQLDINAQRTGPEMHQDEISMQRVDKLPGPSYRPTVLQNIQHSSYETHSSQKLQYDKESTFTTSNQAMPAENPVLTELQVAHYPYVNACYSQPLSYSNPPNQLPVIVHAPIPVSQSLDGRSKSTNAQAHGAHPAPQAHSAEQCSAISESPSHVQSAKKLNEPETTRGMQQVPIKQNSFEPYQSTSASGAKLDSLKRHRSNSGTPAEGHNEICRDQQHLEGLLNVEPAMKSVGLSNPYSAPSQQEYSERLSSSVQLAKDIIVPYPKMDCQNNQIPPTRWDQQKIPLIHEPYYSDQPQEPNCESKSVFKTPLPFLQDDSTHVNINIHASSIGPARQSESQTYIESLNASSKNYGSDENQPPDGKKSGRGNSSQGRPKSSKVTSSHGGNSSKSNPNRQIIKPKKKKTENQKISNQTSLQNQVPSTSTGKWALGEHSGGDCMHLPVSGLSTQPGCHAERFDKKNFLAQPMQERRNELIPYQESQAIRRSNSHVRPGEIQNHLNQSTSSSPQKVSSAPAQTTLKNRDEPQHLTSEICGTSQIQFRDSRCYKANVEMVAPCKPKFSKPGIHLNENYPPAELPEHQMPTNADLRKLPGHPPQSGDSGYLLNTWMSHNWPLVHNGLQDAQQTELPGSSSTPDFSATKVEAYRDPSYRDGVQTGKRSSINNDPPAEDVRQEIGNFSERKIHCEKYDHWKDRLARAKQNPYNHAWEEYVFPASPDKVQSVLEWIMKKATTAKTIEGPKM